MASYSPTDGMKEEARRGLEWRSEFGRGGTEVGIARARDIVNDKNLSDDTVKRMYSFFSRHEVDKEAEGFRPGEDGYPSNGRIAWALWGGDAGYSWSREKVGQMDDERSIPEARPYPNEHAARRIDPARFDSFRRDNDFGGNGIDFIYGILDAGGSELQSIRFDKDLYSPSDAKAWLSDNDFQAISFEEATGERTVEQNVSEEATEVELPEEVVSEVVETEEVQPEVEAADRKAEMQVEKRSMGMEAQIVDEETRTAHIAVSSELPVERSFGKEILMHEAEAINMEFIASGRAPLLLDHDMERQIGVIESVELSDDRKLRAKVRFGRSALAQEVFQDVVDGIRSNISVGYRVNEMTRDDKQRDVYRVRSWSPLEVSVVSIPADPSVGVGRSTAAPEPKPTVEPSIRKEDNMSEEVNMDAVRAEAAKEAARNASDIIALGVRHNKRDLADAAIADGKSIEQFRGELLDVIGNDKPLENNDIGMTRQEKKDFRIVRAIASLANPQDRRLREAAAFEFEVSEAAAQKYGRTAQGIMLPTDVMGAWKRDLNTSDDNELVATDLLSGEFVDVLRNASSVMAAGARMLTGLNGNVSIPTKSAAASGGWIASEGGASSESEPTFGAISMNPKTVGAFTDMTRQMILQSSLDVENLVRDDLTQALALAIDKGALEGTGSSGQPTGILNTSGVNTVTAFAAAVPTFAEMVSLETAVAADNALLGNLAYITDAATAGGLKTKAKDAGSGMFVLEGGEANGYSVITSQQATAGNVYFGNFADCLIGMWGGLDITVDPYTSSNTGTVRIVALQSVDVGVRHAVSFAYGNDGV